MAGLSDATLKGIRCAADIIRGSSRTVVLTGAGISTPSGIPDFRSPESGFWNNLDPLEVASLLTFRHNPELFFENLRSLVVKIHKAEPNVAHFGLSQLEGGGYIQTTITQNVDALHQKAGSRNIIEVHGSLSTLTCGNCYKTVDSQPYIDLYLNNNQIPYCTECNGILKPDVVLMGEQLPSQVWLDAQQASKTCELMIVAGSSLEVLPVAGLPMRAVENGAHLILINHYETYIDVRADVVFHEGVEDIIPRISEEVLK